MRRISWDPEKERKNIRKHGIDFKTAATVFDDPFQVNAQDRFENGEYSLLRRFFLAILRKLGAIFRSAM